MRSFVLRANTKEDAERWVRGIAMQVLPRHPTAATPPAPPTPLHDGNPTRVAVLSYTMTGARVARGV